MAGHSRAVRVTVLGLNYAPEPTGIAPYTARMAAGLLERGHEVNVVTAHPHYPHWSLDDGAAWSTIERLDGVPVRRVRHYVPSNPGSSLHRAWSETTFGVRAAASRWGKPDVVICPSPALISTAVVMARVWGSIRRRAAVGVIVQDLYSAGVIETATSGGVAARAVARLERGVLRGADGVAVIHDRFKRRLVESLGVENAKVDVIRNWTHVTPPPAFDREEFRLRMGWASDEVVVLHAGAMGEKQDLGHVVQAARSAEAMSINVRFVLLGNGGQRPQLEAQAAGCTHIEFRDPLPGDDFVKALASADVLLVHERPGVMEMAVPSKLTSYFSAGRPVIAATAMDSITAHEVRASGAGVVVPAGHPAALVAEAVQLGGDRHTSAVIGARGPVYCETYLSESGALDAYDDWVRALHERRSRRFGAP